MIGIAIKAPLAGIVALVVTILACVAVVSLRAWNTVTANRKDLFKNKNMGDPVTTVLEGLTPLVWAVAAYQLATASAAWSAASLAVCIGILAIGFARARAGGVAVAL